MSNIPHARKLLAEARRLTRDQRVRSLIIRAHNLMFREPPEFRAAPRYRKLSPKQGRIARKLRNQRRGVNDIALHFRTNGGRVSEALRRGA